MKYTTVGGVDGFDGTRKEAPKAVVKAIEQLVFQMVYVTLQTIALKEKQMQDINIKITDRNGTTHDVVAPTDMAMNLMEIVRSYELAEEGTIGICGGMAMCASCQCYVTSDHKLPEISDDEDAMLAEAFHVEDNSRLGCQIQMTPEINGLEVILAPES